MTPVETLIASLKSKKTTLGGILSSAGLIFWGAGSQVETGIDVGQIAQIITAVGVLFIGVFSRDANVSSKESLPPR